MSVMEVYLFLELDTGSLAFPGRITSLKVMVMGMCSGGGQDFGARKIRI